MNDLSLSSLYRRMTSRGAADIDAADLAAAASGADLAPARREALATTLADSAAHASLARLLRELRPESEALAEAVGTRRHAAHPQRDRESRMAAGARRTQRHRHGLRWVGAIAACFVFAFALNVGQRDAPTHWDDVSASASSVVLQDRIFTTRDRIFAATDDAPRGGGDAKADRLFHAHFAVGG